MSSNIKSSSSTLEFPEFLQDRNILVVKIFNQTNYLVNNNNNNINLLKIKWKKSRENRVLLYY